MADLGWRHAAYMLACSLRVKPTFVHSLVRLCLHFFDNGTSKDSDSTMICQRLCLAIFALSIAYASSRDVDVVAQGSVGHVFPAETAISTVEKPLVANMSDLWCQAFRNSAQKTEVLDAARFVHITGLQTHTAEMRNNHMQAYLHFRNAPLTVAGKYKCNLTTAGGENVYGNMFIYMRPVFHDSSKNIEFVEEDKNFTVIAKPVYSSRESTVVLRCPVLGYPKPTIKWFKDPEMKETDSVEIDTNTLYFNQSQDSAA
uniref:Ig-like domain-containing protein n=1 Tax=Steinernema glaseri TaxID=37863 RepID=A0A1I7Y1X7_9BILA